jgi:UDP-N-acetylglucosamine--N-acetylmuramyl-(pentapeptide) pyrophosphoryl-undecaprenol N-acetylglucosamine transferase
LEGFDDARIYFSPCGIGLGHASRSLPIASELRRRGADILFSTYLEGVEYIEKHRFPVVEAPPISMSNDSSGSIDLKLSSVNQGIKAFPTFMRQVNFELRYMKAFEPDAVVSDSRLSSIFAAKMLRLPTLLILNQFTPLIPRQRDRFMLFKVADGVVMTLIGRGWGLSDGILIPDFPAPYTLSIDSLRIPRPYQRKVEMVGAILPKKPSEAKDKGEIRRSLGVSKEQKLIYVGISGPRAERIPLLRILEPIFESFPDDYRVIMSMGTPEGGAEPKRRGSLVEMNWIEDRFDLLNACDLVISRGGHETMMQSICFGKPAIIIPVSKHPEQYGNARRAQELGVGNAVHQRNIEREGLLLLIEEMLEDTSYIDRLAELNKKQIGDGVERSVSALEKIMHN